MFFFNSYISISLVIADANTGQIKKSIHINQKIRKLLAVGQKFALILLPYFNGSYQNLAVVDLDQRKIVGGCTVPHSRANNPDFTQVTIGNLDWLDGFDDQSSNDLVVALSTVVKSLCIVKWDL